MFSRLNIRLLVVVLAVLMVGLLVGEMLSSRKAKTIRGSVLTLETADVNSIKIYPLKDKGRVLTFELKDNKWHLRENGRAYLAEQGVVRNLLFLMRNASVERVVATKKESWEEFKLDDAHVLAVEMRSDEGTEVFYIGGNHYVSGGKSDDGRSVYADGAHYLTFMRIDDASMCYAVGGLIRPLFEKSSDAYRDKIVLKGVVGEWESLNFSYANAPSVSYQKQAGKWTKNGGVCDSMAMVSYLRSLSKIEGEAFYHGRVADLGKPLKTMSIEGRKMSAPVTIRCFGNDTLRVFESSLRPTDYFYDKHLKMEKKIFKDKP